MRSIILSCAFCVLFVLPAGAQLTGQESPLLPEHRTELINDVSRLLTDIYIYPEVAEKMVALIKRKNKRGEYAQFERLDEFTRQLTEDLHSISHDLHLHVAATSPPPTAAGGGELPPQDQVAQELARARAGNFGFQRLELLPGNIGYMDLRGFVPAEIGGPTAIAAMNFLANASAIIFDLRRNGGGDPSMIQLLSSYLFEEPQHLNSFYVRQSDTTQQFWTQASVPGRKLVDTPVYILTSRNTFSAAEEFTYNLKNMERGTVVGETTGGGAHPVDFHLSEMGGGHYARISMPFGRAINPITGTNWEGTGVSPHIEAPAAQALEVAQLEILNQLAENGGNENRQFEIEWARDELNYQLHGAVDGVTGAEFYTGSYGPRKVFLENDTLYYQRGEGPRFELQPMNSEDLFHVGELDNFRIRFGRDAAGKVNELRGLYDNGRVDRNVRDD